MVTLSPVGLAAAPVANQVSFLATFKEKLRVLREVLYFSERPLFY